MARMKPAFAELLLPHAFADLARHDGAAGSGSGSGGGGLSAQLASAIATHMLPEVGWAGAGGAEIATKWRGEEGLALPWGPFAQSGLA